MISIGIDVGGTHTDLVAINSHGQILVVDKTKTTKEDIVKAIVRLIESNFKDEIVNLNLIVNGTTIGMNAILEKKFPEIALITTKGFKDVILMRRETKAELTNLQWDKPDPLVKRRNIFEVNERIDYNGKIFKEIDKNSVKEVIKKIKERRITNIAVVLIHSYANPTHEKLLKNMILQEIPTADVTISYEILPEWREFERTYNTVLATVLKPILSNYIVDLQNRLERIGFKGNLEIMQANAGVAAVESICSNPVSTLFSGVVGGVIGGLVSCRHLENGGNIITFDMGGTSTDISLINNGVYTVSTEKELEWEGTLRFPCVDVHSIGAGGGSIAWVDEANYLHVGPRSAGAVPGPACYDLGGEEPTVTDANLVLGYLNPDNFVGGRYKLSIDKAKRAIWKVAKKLDLSVSECALGIRAIVNSNMVYGIRHVSIEKGHDPREYTLVAFGGAGPLHAAELMEHLNMRKCIVPLYPGNVSAIGLLGAQPKIDLVRTKYVRLDDADFGELEVLFKTMENEGIKGMETFGVQRKELLFVRSLDMRYTGQTHELIIDNIPLNLLKITKEEIAKLFHSKHNKIYGYFNEYEPIAIVNLRLSILGPERSINLYTNKNKHLANPTPSGKRTLIFSENKKLVEVEVEIFKRDLLPLGFERYGPLVIEEDLSTTLIPPEFKVKVLSGGLLEIKKRD